MNSRLISKGGQTSRKELERELAKYRKQFEEARNSYTNTNSRLNELQQTSNQAHARMDDAKQKMLESYDILQTMDMAGASGTRNRGDINTYFVDGKEFHIDKNDTNDIKMTPWKEFKAKAKTNECTECADSSDCECVDTSDLDVEDIANAADTFATLCE